MPLPKERSEKKGKTERGKFPTMLYQGGTEHQRSFLLRRTMINRLIYGVLDALLLSSSLSLRSTKISSNLINDFCSQEHLASHYHPVPRAKEVVQREISFQEVTRSKSYWMCSVSKMTWTSVSFQTHKLHNTSAICSLKIQK